MDNRLKVFEKKVDEIARRIKRLHEIAQEMRQFSKDFIGNDDEEAKEKSKKLTSGAIFLSSLEQSYYNDLAELSKDFLEEAKIHAKNEVKKFRGEDAKK